MKKPGGANHLFFNGKIITGPNPVFLLFTFLLIIVPVFLFLERDASKISAKPFGSFAVFLVMVFSIASLIFLGFAALTEPGIINRQTGDGEFGGDFHTEFIVDVVNGQSLQRKWCDTCRLYRPLRARHCRDCDNCVHRFDHHCPWIDNCIGARNHRYFILFIASTAILASLVFFSILWVVYLDDVSGTLEGYFEAMFTEGHRYFVLVVSMGTAVVLSNLTLYHIHLVGRNLTTAEHMKGDFPNGNPFSFGFKSNCLSFWLTPPSRSELEIESIELANQIGAFKE